MKLDTTKAHIYLSVIKHRIKQPAASVLFDFLTFFENKNFSVFDSTTISEFKNYLLTNKIFSTSDEAYFAIHDVVSPFMSSCYPELYKL